MSQYETQKPTHTCLTAFILHTLTHIHVVPSLSNFIPCRLSYKSCTCPPYCLSMSLFILYHLAHRLARSSISLVFEPPSNTYAYSFCLPFPLYSCDRLVYGLFTHFFHSVNLFITGLGFSRNIFIVMRASLYSFRQSSCLQTSLMQHQLCHQAYSHHSPS